MRLWTLHPQYLDTKGLLALWREGLLAQKVLAGQTIGYRNHPQLDRFKRENDPVAAVATYLLSVYDEAVARGYNFNRQKLADTAGALRIVATRGQLAYEWEHLKRKLMQRDTKRYLAAAAIAEPLAHPMIDIVPGGIESWEVGGASSQ
jgi:hypothetical protein